MTYIALAVITVLMIAVGYPLVTAFSKAKKEMDGDENVE